MTYYKLTRVKHLNYPEEYVAAVLTICKNAKNEEVLSVLYISELKQFEDTYVLLREKVRLDIPPYL